MVRRVLYAMALVAMAAGPGPTTDQAPLVIVDNAGKEQKLKSWNFASGVRHLGWLALPQPPSATEKGDDSKKNPSTATAVGPVALEFREEESTAFVEGILTFLLLDRLRSLEYDFEQKTVTARVATGPKADDNEVLTGPTRFERVNKLTIEAEVDKGDLGIASVRFFGGTARGIRGMRFPSPKPDKPSSGRPAVITAAGRMVSTHKVMDLQALYRLKNGRERLSPFLMFEKTLKLDIARIEKITVGGGDDEVGTWQVQMKNAAEESLKLIRVIKLDDQDAQFVGLLGRVTGGYKLFPLQTIGEVAFDATEASSDTKADK